MCVCVCVCVCVYIKVRPLQVDLLVSKSSSHAVGRGFTFLPGHTIKVVQTASPLLDTHALGYELDSAARLFKVRAVCGTVYAEMHLKISWDQLVLNPGFQSCTKWHRCRKSTCTIMDLSNQMYTCMHAYIHNVYRNISLYNMISICESI